MGPWSIATERCCLNARNAKRKRLRYPNRVQVQMWLQKRERVPLHTRLRRDLGQRSESRLVLSAVQPASKPGKGPPDLERRVLWLRIRRWACTLLRPQSRRT